MSRYLVTGCAGFLGSHLAEELLRRGDHVVGVDAFTDYYPRVIKESNVEAARKNPGLSVVEADLAEAMLAPLLDGVDGVFHLAAQPGVRGSWGDSFAVYVRDNILATQRLFEAAALVGTRVVVASTSSVYGNAETYPTREDTFPRPISPYGVTKLACESLARAYSECFGPETVVLRYFTVYGPRQRPDMAFARIISALLEERPFHVFGSGEQSRDFTYVADAVAATVAAMEAGRPGRIYNVGGGSEATLNEVIGLCEHLAKRRLVVRSEPPAAGDVRRTAADTSLIRSELGWSQRTSLEEGLAAQLAAAQATTLQGPRDDPREPRRRSRS
ncbi:MAG: NAD-dependent epimerase/dehydratase family protein [Gaiellaceae bacterium]